jgi:hypothetical protein
MQFPGLQVLSCITFRYTLTYAGVMWSVARVHDEEAHL